MVTIRRVNPIPVDVLIFENLGTPYLVKAIPEEMNYVILNNRDELPIMLTRRFIFSWIRLLLNTTLGIRQSYIIALMAEFGARIVLSFADNSPSSQMVVLFNIPPILIKLTGLILNFFSNI